jgi:dihydroflavonol-4-reductase
LNVLVTGATGFIGSHVLPRLLAGGHRVRALVRPTSDTSGMPDGVEVVRGSLGDPAAACAGMEGLIHLAGISGKVLGRGDPGRELRRVNVDDTIALFTAARAAGVRRGVLVTSMWTVLRPDLADRSPYVRSRRDAEEGAIAAGGSALATVVLCPSFVVGAGDRGPNMPGGVVRALLRGRMPIVPAAGSTWIAAADAADQIVAALRRGAAGGRYLLGAEYVTYRDLGRAVARMAGRRGPLLTAPAGALRAGGAVGDLALAAFGRRAPIPLRAGIDLLCQTGAADCSSSWAALGRPKVPVLEAVGEAVEWFRTHGYA